MKQMLIYDQVAMVARDKHRAVSIMPTNNYDFARQTNSVPLVIGEFALTAMHYAIVFGQSGDGPIPAAVLGVRDDENVFVAADGKWTAPYIPAFIRRYPFVFGTDDKNETYTLMLDESYPGINTEGRGERLFDIDGKETVFLRNIMGFLSEYQGGVQATQLFSKKLADLDLLDGAEAHLPTPGDPERRLRGFTIISREKLRKLPAKTLAQLNESGELELIYLHLMSLSNLQRLQEKAATAG